MKNISYIFLILIYCKSRQIETNFVFQEDKYLITLEIENNILEIEKENTILVKFKNIDKERAVFSGYKLRQEYSEKIQSDKMILIATPVFSEDSDKVYKLSVSFKNEEGKHFSHQFLIPTKPTQN